MFEVKRLICRTQTKSCAVAQISDTLGLSKSKMLLRIGLLYSTFPKRQTKILMCSLSPVFKKAVILVYRENNKLKKKMVSIVSVALICSHVHNWCLWFKRLHFSFSLLCDFFYVMTRPTLVQPFPMGIQTPLSSVGLSRSLRCRSDWEILQVRSPHTATLSPLNHSQSTSTKPFCSFSSFVFRHTPQSLFSLYVHAHTHTHNPNQPLQAFQYSSLHLLLKLWTIFGLCD